MLFPTDFVSDSTFSLLPYYCSAYNGVYTIFPGFKEPNLFGFEEIEKVSCCMVLPFPKDASKLGL